MKITKITSILYLFFLCFPVLGVYDYIDTESNFRIISKGNRIICAHDLSSTVFDDERHGKGFFFNFIREGADSYRIKGVIPAKDCVLNVVGAWDKSSDREVSLRPNDGTWKGHRTFRARRNADGSYDFLNEESGAYLAINLESGKLEAIHFLHDVRTDFRIEKERAKGPSPISQIQKKPEPLLTVDVRPNPRVGPILRAETEGMIMRVLRSFHFGPWYPFR